MSDSLRLALIIQFGGDVKVSEDYEIGIPGSVHLSQPRQLDTKETPFVVMTGEHWNAFQKLMDELGVREKFKTARGMGIMVPKKNIVSVKSEVQ